MVRLSVSIFITLSSVFFVMQEVPQLPVVCESSGSSSDLPSQVSAICQHPDAVTVQSHFSVILKVIGSPSSNEHGRNHKIMV